MVKFFVHDGSVNLIPHWCQEEELPTLLEKPSEAALKEIQSGAEHCIYAVYHYHQKTKELEKINVYYPPVPLDDAEYTRRTEATRIASPGCKILAQHTTNSTL